MDQISPPMRIVLAVAVVFLAAYMLVLKPKDETSAPAATPSTPATASATDGNKAQTGLGKAVEGARGAAAATEAKQDAEAAASGEETTNKPGTTSSTPSTKTAPSTAAAKPVDPSLAKLPKWLQNSMDKKVVAILFTNGKSADDRRTRAALKQSFSAHGKVVTRAVPISRIARYRPVAQGVDVQQSPTLMVIARDRSAQALVGYSSVDTINQAVIDGLLATDVPVRRVKFLQTVRTECRQLFSQAIIGETQGDTFTGAKKNLDAVIATNASSLGTIRNAPAPARYRGVKSSVVKYFAAEQSALEAFRSQAVGKKTIDQVKVRSIGKRVDKAEAKAGLELAAVGINACN